MRTSSLVFYQSMQTIGERDRAAVQHVHRKENAIFPRIGLPSAAAGAPDHPRIVILLTADHPDPSTTLSHALAPGDRPSTTRPDGVGASGLPNGAPVTYSIALRFSSRSSRRNGERWSKSRGTPNSPNGGRVLHVDLVQKSVSQREACPTQKAAPGAQLNSGHRTKTYAVTK